MEIPDPLEDFESFQKSLFRSLVSASNAANSIPFAEIGFFRSLDREFANDLDLASATILSTANKLTNHTALELGMQDSEVSIEDIDDINDRFFGVIDVVDSLYERVDLTLDELAGRAKNTNVSDFATNRGLTKLSTTTENGSRLEYKLLHANIVRPQLKFKDKVDNSLTTPFVLKIHDKPNAQVPLSLPSAGELAANPYTYEIEHLNYPGHLFQSREPVSYSSFDKTQAAWIDTEEELDKLVAELASVQEIAVDLEHHDYRSFQGFTCLMQLSTRENDYVIDTLALRDVLWKLNQAFTDPNIVKVFHGATSDIIWLQQDFGLYIVDLFDTYDATKVLDFPKHSLAYLLEKYCQVLADKKYQLADWRIRPLTEEMLSYARSDTHYLLYIYDCLREELLAKSNDNNNLLHAVLHRSSVTSASTHQKEVYDADEGLGPNGWSGLLRKRKYPMNHQQMAVFKVIHQWRDSMARQEDESPRYILPNHMLFSMVERMPDDSATVVGCCNPCPPCVRMHAQPLAMAIQRAKTEALYKPTTHATTPAQPARAPESSLPVSTSQKPKEVKHVDPDVFDLTKVQHHRQQLVHQFGSGRSSLFDTNARSTHTTQPTNDESSALAVARHIRATLTVRLPVEDLRIKAVYDAAQLQAQQNNAQNSENADDEHVFVSKEKRSTKKKSKKQTANNKDTDGSKKAGHKRTVQDDNDDVLIIKDFGGRKKKSKRA
ncbi:hypothetical protein DM01DRAFT_1312331 [Hesseltinella vesiculosa]|uniref:HRDC domain-containing protein n=1 Tax=Hesseltinella vesiculosa TaxID=101127 RepID=A0A1X2G4J3_9FUNG|nr:hypothetical protein DM01DRAFT_1312331 [Hesseltinella vesiculosa]